MSDTVAYPQKADGMLPFSLCLRFLALPFFLWSSHTVQALTQAYFQRLPIVFHSSCFTTDLTAVTPDVDYIQTLLILKTPYAQRFCYMQITFVC